MGSREKYEIPDWVVNDYNSRLNNHAEDEYDNQDRLSHAEFMKKLEERALERKKNKAKNSERTAEVVCSVIFILVLTVIYYMILF